MPCAEPEEVGNRAPLKVNSKHSHESQGLSVKFNFNRDHLSRKGFLMM